MNLVPTSFPANFSTLAPNGEQNSTYGDWCPDAEYSRLHTTVLPAYILLVAVLGMGLNVFVLMVFYLHKMPCNVAEIYLTNLAAADLILMIFLPFWAVYAIKGFNWPFPEFMCKVVPLSINMNATCSVYFLVLISFDRYFALVHPLTLQKFRRPKYAKLSCALVWGFGLLLSVYILVLRKVGYDPRVDKKVCYLQVSGESQRKLIVWFQTVLGFILPICFISFCTFRIIQSLRRRSVDGSDTHKGDQKATILVLAVLLAFMICWVPYHIAKILLELQHSQVLTECSTIKIINICNNVFTYFAYCNSVLNPILYVIVGQNFRKKIRDVFKQWSNRRNSTSHSLSTHSNLLKWS